jgi:hypothetical protein
LRTSDEETETNGARGEDRLIQTPDEPEFRAEHGHVNAARQHQAPRQSVAMEPSAHDRIALTSDADVMPGAVNVERLGE